MKIRACLALIILVIIGTGALWINHVSAQELAAQRREEAILAREKARTFADQMQRVLALNSNITMSVVTISDTDGLKQYGTDGTFDGASTGKLLTAVDYLWHVEHAQASLHQTIDGRQAEDWLRLMLVNSDDTAWQELNDFLGHEDLSRFAASIGFTQYGADDNTFTARDVATLLKKLYDHQLLNNVDRSLVLNYLKQANYRDFIVAATPEGDTVYHKAGIDNDNVHDAAVIDDGGHDLVLVIFTNGNGTYDWGGRAKLMQSITRDATTAYL